MMKKNGYTLLEVIISLSILSMISIITLSFYIYTSKKYEETKSQYVALDVASFIFKSKSLCLSQDKSSVIIINDKDKELIFNMDGNIEKMKYPKEYDISVPGGKIYLKGANVISDEALTITIRCIRRKVYREISMPVSASLPYIKEENDIK